MADPEKEIIQGMTRPSMSGDKTFSDPIHGHITLPPLCVKIIDTPQFQRLRYINQLAGNYFVYPGACHNRFEHSLGVCHLAGEMVETLAEQFRNEKTVAEQSGNRVDPHLEITKADKLCVQLAGLCHDLGHGPFSHLFEKKFIPAARRDRKDWRHEDCSDQMFDHLLDENHINLTHYGLTEPEDRLFIKELIMGVEEGRDNKGRTERKSFLYQIVANKETGIDVDKWDYFARDCHGLGIRCSFDHTRLLKFTRAIEDDGGRWSICFRDKEVSNIYDMFHTRELLHRRAYQHKTSVAIEMMISDALIKADKCFTFGPDNCTMSECIDCMKAFTELDDRVLYRILYSAPNNKYSECDKDLDDGQTYGKGGNCDQDLDDARKIIQRIYRRDLYVCVGQTKPKKGCFMTAKQKKSAEQSLIAMDPSLNDDDFFLDTPTFDYGKNVNNPVDHVKFYSKHNIKTARKITRAQVSHMLPDNFRDQMVRCYSRNSDKEVTDRIRKCFVLWSQENIGVDSVELEDGYQNIV